MSPRLVNKYTQTDDQKSRPSPVQTRVLTLVCWKDSERKNQRQPPVLCDGLARAIWDALIARRQGAVLRTEYSVIVFFPQFSNLICTPCPYSPIVINYWSTLTDSQQRRSSLQENGNDRHCQSSSLSTTAWRHGPMLSCMFEPLAPLSHPAYLHGPVSMPSSRVSVLLSYETCAKIQATKHHIKSRKFWYPKVIIIW